jgi:serine phosphatase RsbU (regulator of sigma subunit)
MGGGVAADILPRSQARFDTRIRGKTKRTQMRVLAAGSRHCLRRVGCPYTGAPLKRALRMGRRRPPRGMTSAQLTENPDADSIGVARGRRRPSGAAAIALILGLLVTVALSITTSVLYDHNERRLLRLRARELSLVLTAVVPSIQTPLASAAELADATKGNPQKFREFMSPYVGTGRQFSSASLWGRNLQSLRPTAVVGLTPAIMAHPKLAQRFFQRARHTGKLSVVGLLSSSPAGLGYEFSTPGTTGGFAAYAESPLPADRRSRTASGQGFSDLHYALYLGRSRDLDQLLVTDAHRLPLTGRTASTVVPFGDTSLDLVVSPKDSLGGGFFADLPWVIALFGALMSIAAAAMTERIVRRRVHAERLASTLDRVASENRRMYDQQRGIAQTLQHALLPASLPEVDGIETSARYVPAASGIDIGGDWYDLLRVDERNLLLLIGDVSGHGLEAATTMASVRYAALAYAARDPKPGSVLDSLSTFVAKAPTRYLATVMCALLDVQASRMTIASAGHLPPLLISGQESAFLDQRTGPPIGVSREVRYAETTAAMPPSATLIAFTDGLVERRGESLDVGLQRLRDTVAGQPVGLEDLIARIVGDMSSPRHDDDTAILGVRWHR